MYPSKRIFKFGDGHKVTAISSVKIPAQMGETNCFIITEIIKEKILLLLSKSSLKKADTILNIKNDTIKMFGQIIPIESSFNGHYSISILAEITSNFDDNGGEFVSKDFIDFCENFNIKIKTTSAESPWSNRICECHNAIITETLLKVKEDSKCDWKTALDWALSAKNSLINVNRFSPHQIVFGKNIKIPSIYVDQPSADLPDNEIVIKHLNTLHATRQAFITTESSRKLKLALPKQTWQTRNFFETGSEVYFKRNIDQKWRGPGIVVGQYGAIVFVHQRGLLYKVHYSRTQKACDLNLPPTIDLQNNENNKSSLDNVQKNKSLPLIYDSSDETDDNDNTTNKNQNENHDMNNTSEGNDKEAAKSSSNSINNQNHI